MGRKCNADRIESSSAKKSGRKTRRREAEDALAVENAAGAEDAPAVEDPAGAEDATAVEVAPAAEDATGAEVTGGAKKAVEDEEVNPDGDGEEETGVGEEVETGVDKDEEKSGEEAEAEAGDEVEEADTEEVQAAAASSSKGKGIKEEGKANKNKRNFVIKYCKHSGPLFEARAEELKAAFEFGHDFNVAISTKVSARKQRVLLRTAVVLLLLLSVCTLAEADSNETDLLAARAEKLRADAAKARADAVKTLAEAEIINDKKPFMTLEKFYSCLLYVALAAVVCVVIFACSWVLPITDYWCARRKWGDLKRQKQLDKAGFGRFQDVEMCMREDEESGDKIDFIVARYKNSKAKDAV